MKRIGGWILEKGREDEELIDHNEFEISRRKKRRFAWA
jgi:hypothetical protein